MLEAVRRLGERVASDRGYELVDVELKQSRKGVLVRLYVDKQGGIGLDELQAVSEEVSAILDVEEPISTAYTLEVSSPGIDRPLRSEADFRRSVGRLVSVDLSEPVDDKRRLTGRLAVVQDGVITLETAKGGPRQVPLSAVSQGRLEVEWKRPAAEAGSDRS